MKKLFILLIVLVVLGTSCSDFLTVNEKNPNSATAVPTSLVLPAALNATSRIVNRPDNFDFIYLWHGCLAISSGYAPSGSLIGYNLLNSSYQGNWSNSYLNLQNYDYIEKNSTTDQLKPYKAIAKIMKAYVYQVLVDTYGNVPYSEALRSAEGLLKPAYDDQQDIYEDLVVQLDSAMYLISSSPADAEEVGDYDIIYHGDIGMWWKFANTLKLRLLVNQSDMAGRDGYITTALATTSSTPADYLGAGEGAMLNPGFSQSTSKMNPFWETFYKQDGSQQSALGYYVANQDACDFLTSTNDPRKLRFFQSSTGAATDTTITGNYFARTYNPVKSTSKLGPGMLSSYDMDAPIFTDFESLFLQAEAAQRGLITGNVKALYESAVTQSIIHMGGADGTSAGASAYLAQTKTMVNFDTAYAANNEIELIMTQKWCALNGISPNTIWTDYRRTGFPDFLHFSLYPYRKNDTPMVRLLYPQTELNLNNDNVLAQGDINVFTSKIFWQN